MSIVSDAIKKVKNAIVNYAAGPLSQPDYLAGDKYTTGVQTPYGWSTLSENTANQNAQQYYRGVQSQNAADTAYLNSLGKTYGPYIWENTPANSSDLSYASNYSTPMNTGYAASVGNSLGVPQSQAPYDWRTVKRDYYLPTPQTTSPTSLSDFYNGYNLLQNMYGNIKNNLTLPQTSMDTTPYLGAANQLASARGVTG
jgi:hypothetical protein